MLVQAEDVPLVEANALKHAVPVKQSVIEHGNLGVGLIDKLSIEVNLHRRRPLERARKFVQPAPNFAL